LWKKIPHGRAPQENDGFAKEGLSSFPQLQRRSQDFGDFYARNPHFSGSAVLNSI